MGNYLTTPITKKHTTEGSNKILKYACSSMQGWRISMEDAHITEPNFTDNSSLFAVFDGHGGKEVAMFCERHFATELKQNKNFLKGNFETALKENFLKMDELIMSEEGHKELMELCDPMMEMRAGCTANVVLIVDNVAYIANAGDSRCLAYTNQGKIEKLSEDHKPEDPKEFKRITKAGGFVVHGRVCGNLNLSRAIGDMEFKKSEGLKPEEQMISAEPDVVRRVLRDDSFLLIGCDGMWELMSDEQICAMVASRIESRFGLGDIVEEWLERGIAADTDTGLGCDNMSGILVKFG